MAAWTLLLRHGQASSNRADEFAGRADVPLTALGREQASRVGGLLGGQGLVPDVMFTSPLVRAHETADLVAREAGSTVAPLVVPDLVERHYGALQGRGRHDAVREFGAEQVAQWRRTWHARPPADPDGHGESLAQVHARVVPFWDTVVRPLLDSGRRVLVVSHGHVLRALLCHLERQSTDRAARREIPLAIPLVRFGTVSARPAASDAAVDPDLFRRSEDTVRQNEALLDVAFRPLVEVSS